MSKHKLSFKAWAVCNNDTGRIMLTEVGDHDMIIARIKVWLAALKPKPPCRHPHYFERRWLSGDGTPMVSFSCKECGYHDTGHVHGDSEGWEGTTST